MNARPRNPTALNKHALILLPSAILAGPVLAQVPGGPLYGSPASGMSLEDFLAKATSMLPVILPILIVAVTAYFVIRRRVVPRKEYQEALKLGVRIPESELIRLYYEKKGIDLKFILSNLIAAHKLSLGLNIKDMDILSDKSELPKMIEALGKAKQAGMKTEKIQTLDAHCMRGGNVATYIETFVALHSVKIEVNPTTRGMIEGYFDKFGSLARLRDLILFMRKHKIKVVLEEAVKYPYTTESIENITRAIIDAQHADIYQYMAAKGEVRLGDFSDLPLAHEVAHEASDPAKKPAANAPGATAEPAAATTPEPALGPEQKHDQRKHLMFTQGDIFRLHSENLQVDALISAMIKADRVGLRLRLEDVLKHLNRDKGIGLEIVEVMVRAKNAGLEIDFRDIEAHQFIGGDIQKFVSAIITVHKAKLDLSRRDLEAHTLSGGDVAKYTSALAALKSKPELDISQRAIEKHSISKGDPAKVISAYAWAQSVGLDVTFDLLAAIDLKHDEDVNAVIKKALSMEVFTVPPVRMVAKSGVEIILGANVVLKLRISKIFNGTSKEVIFHRIREKIVAQAEGFDTHQDVLAQLNTIAKRVLADLFAHEKEQELNLHSAYDILDLTLPEFAVGKDAYADLRREEAELHAQNLLATAEAEYKMAEAEVERAFAEAIRTGKSGKNEYHKALVYKGKTATIPPKEDHEHKQAEHGHDKDEKGHH